MTPALKGWHRGEHIVRQRLGYDKLPETALFYLRIHAEMPEQHSTFYSTRLEFLPVCILDKDGRPWSSILADKGGELGFVRHPRFNTLDITAKLWAGEPLWKTLKAIERGQDPALIAGVGVEVSTRRRNKFAGKIVKADVKDTSWIWNSVALILESDTVWFGTAYIASNDESSEYPSHLGMNHRGGRPGFMRVKPSDGRTVVLPDFSGDRYMTSLGNVEATPLASLTFVSFTTGDILYVTGQAKNVFGAEAREVMPFQDGLTEIYATGYTYVRDAFPALQPSPYSPPVRLLAEEDSSRFFGDQVQPKAILTAIKMHNPTIATFEWESSVPLLIAPGQAIIMDFRPLLGERQYQHMADDNPSVLNDDFIRTWTVSSASDALGLETRKFSLTMREKVGGAVTPALFNIARKASESGKPLDDARALSVSVNVVGVTGDFTLPQVEPGAPLPSTVSQNIRNLVWFAGGIGITPFLSMLAALSKISIPSALKISLVISTREPGTLLSLVALSLGISDSQSMPSYLSIDVFTNASIPDARSKLSFTHHSGHIGFAGTRFANTQVFVCGPDTFEKFVLDSLSKSGVDSGRVHREGFTY
ncbi:hypothetical protein CPB84DRAFT_1794099 [Gymnopilus junonius]|uniref:FAD-binding FR-type domain-containing protein n=1 Tax=Gymnopilus junonius TaxID=109634 RepID=A0A9P5NAI2_GYMJU|nr:hypothetical protein CPB84DRAFT_1794099 [Gymnopilus junonius]